MCVKDYLDEQYLLFSDQVCFGKLSLFVLLNILLLFFVLFLVLKLFSFSPPLELIQ